jgi:hypothetical protein
MDIKITKEEANWSEVNHGKKVVVVRFPKCISRTTGKPFMWLPTYKQLDEIKGALHEIEQESWNEQI